MNLVAKLGTSLYETHGALCEEIIKVGYDVDDYYDGSGDTWGNFDKVLVMVAHIRGAKSYEEYLKLFETIKREGDKPVSKQLYARLTGIKTKTTTQTQTERTRRYRQRRGVELLELRELTALKWIDDNPKQAIEYIKDKYSNLL